jgi:hypothetical protein
MLVKSISRCAPSAPRFSMARVARAFGALLCFLSVAGCGGKLAPLDTDAGPAHDAHADDGASSLVVTSVTPSSGPNSGGTQVVIGGEGFVPGGSLVSFGGFPATGVSCASTTECTAVSPFAGYQDFGQQVHVQVSVPGSRGDAPQTSPAGPLDVFTYTSGPDCHFELSCAEASSFANLVITCPTSVSFYQQIAHTLTGPVSVGTTYTTPTEDLGIDVVACFGDAASTSCTTFAAASSQWACGTTVFCWNCVNRFHGYCSPGPPPTCVK